MSARTYADRCPGVLRPWIADDGAIVRLRLVGGVVPATTLRALIDIAERWADGTILLTKRTNLQLRGIAHEEGAVPDALVDALTQAGLLPSQSHELVRNIMVSPLTGRAGGRADLRPVAIELDRLLCADADLAGLAGRFLFVLDDGRGDVSSRALDVGLMAVESDAAQLRIGSHRWGEVAPLDEAPKALAALASRFLQLNGEGATALWHADELSDDRAVALGGHHARDLRTQVRSFPPAFGIIAQDDGRFADHVAVTDGLLTRAVADDLLARAGDELVVTPWHGIVVPDLDRADLDSTALANTALGNTALGNAALGDTALNDTAPEKA
ncbi:nitrite reductase [Aeromicrobium sp.]|uniref:nitrite reductase n=1 Tax=Aeromicrobium sp. TaxID=1871063 RepID=UPI0019AB91B3|nr:nitrite reductase [Aeromicrobium sp.]MBC7632649.1 sulfite reductase subunit beta [Aeromicrobium sp.]